MTDHASLRTALAGGAEFDDMTIITVRMGDLRALLADYDRMRDAAHQMHALYPNVWDRADGCLVVFPENVERFDAAFEGLRAALAQEGS